MKKKPISKRAAIALLSSTFVLLAFASYLLTVLINSSFMAILGTDTQARFEAPLVEEAFKPLALVVLIICFSKAKNAKIRNRWMGKLKSIKACYGVGYASGLIFGLLENVISYNSFSNLRALAPFFHAFGAGLVGMGIYYLMIMKKKGILGFASLYLSAVALHSTWNSSANLPSLRIFLAGATTGLGLLLLAYFKKSKK